MSATEGPILSIITVAYHNAAGLRDTMASLRPLLNLPGLAWEHVVVDSSPEAHQEVLREFPKDWPLLYIHQEPKGIYPALNLGLARAKGRFLWFLNGGDLLHSSDALQKAVASLAEHTKASWLCAAAILTRDGAVRYRIPPRLGWWPLLGINRVCHQAILYRREAFQPPAGSYNEQLKLAADYEHHLLLKLLGKNGIPLSLELVQYDTGGRSTDYFRVLGEFAKVHAGLRPLMPWWLAIVHRFVWRLERWRLSLFQWVKGGPLAAPLGRAWLVFQRRKSKFLR